MTEPLPEYSGCLWPLDPGCLGPEWDEFDDEVRLRATALASNTLHRLTGRRVGGCPITVRPCKPVSCGMPRGFYARQPFYPGMNISGEWVNNACGSCRQCQGTTCEVELPAPVGRIDEVRVNGTLLDAGDYEVQNGHILVYTGTDDCPFPATQDLSAAVPALEVTYLNAYPVDSLGAFAAGILAMEFAKACKGRTGKNCRLPANVVNVVRAGVSYELRPGLFPDGYTGIDEVDSYIGDWNPRGMIQDSMIWSPGMNEPRITTLGGA